MTNLETIANLVRACASCGVLHSVDYRCAAERKIDSFLAARSRMPRGFGRGGSATGMQTPIALAKGTR